MIYEIKRGDVVIAAVRASGSQERSVMAIDRVPMSFTLPNSIDFKRGDTVEVYGQVYKMNRSANETQTADKAGYQYELEFEALYYDLGKWQLKGLDKNNQLTQGEVFVMGTAATIVDLVVRNANRVDSGWTIGIVDETDARQFTYVNQSLLAVLQDLSNQFDTEFHIDNKTIHLQKRQASTGLVLEYGKGNELYELFRGRTATSVINRLYVEGGSRNLPEGYGFGRLQLPVANRPYLQAPLDPNEEVIEHSITVDNIFPSRTGRVTSLGANDLEVIDTTIDFNINDHLSGANAIISFVSGQLASFEFEITKYDHATKKITFARITDDKAYPDGVPSGGLKASVDDKYVLLNLDMPASYVTDAQDKLLLAGQTYLEANLTDKHDYRARLSPIWVKQTNPNIRLGYTVDLIDSVRNINKTIRIAGYTRDLQDEASYTEFSLSDTITASTYARQYAQQERILFAIQNAGLLDPEQMRKNLFLNRLSERDGYLFLGPDKVKAGLADHALDSDKWDGHDFADYLNQPVRTTDSPSFQAVTANALTANQTLLIPQVANPTLHALWKSSNYLMLGANKVWAGNSDLWNGLAQPDYLTQPVRPSDSPVFTGISSPSFVSGFSGSGYRMALDGNGNYMLEVDRLSVRKDFSVYELIINKIRATNGSLWVSDAIKITNAYTSGGEYICQIDTAEGTIGIPFVAGDIVRCQAFNGTSIKYYTAQVTYVSAGIGEFSIIIIEGSGVPSQGDDIVRIGNISVVNRQGALYLTSSDSGAPYLDVIDGVTNASLAGKTKVRLGKLNGIVDPDFGALSGYGLYAQNGYFKGVFRVANGSNVYTMDQTDGKINDIQVGGRNYYSNKFTTVLAVAGAYDLNKNTPESPNGFIVTGPNPELHPEGGTVRLYHVVNSDGLWTVSGFARGTQMGLAPFSIDICDLGLTPFVIPGNNEWSYFEHTVNVTNHDTNPNVYDFVDFSQFGHLYYQFKDIKVEKGNKATDWTPAPEDITDEINTLRTETYTEFSVLEGKIQSKVGTTTFETFQVNNSNAISTAKSQATTDANNYTDGKVADVGGDVSGLATRVTTAETNITQNALQIESRATRTEVTTQVTTAKTEAINAAADDATTKANAAAMLAQAAQDDATAAKNYINNVLPGELDAIYDALDGLMEQHFQTYDPTLSNEPAVSWTTTSEKETHLGDLFYNTVNGKSWRWVKDGAVYSWSEIVNSDLQAALQAAAQAQDTADSKRRVFTVTPFTPYDIGDLWVQGNGGDILKAKTAKTAAQSFLLADWEKASKYTDDTVANAAAAAVDTLTTRVVSAETAITQNADQIVLRATKSEVITAIEIKDTRNDNELPSYYYANHAKREVKEFKTSGVIGLAGLGGFVTMVTKVPWIDSSGGPVVQEVISGGKMYTRSGTSTWGDWVESETLAGATTKANNALNGANAYTDGQVTAINTRITSAETTITQNSDAIVLRATKNDVTTAKTEAINTAATDATNKVNAVNVGGRNYYSKDSTLISMVNDVLILKDLSSNGFRLTGNPVGLGVARLYNVIKSDGDWTVSFWGKANAPSQLSIDICDGPQTNIQLTTEYQYYTLTKNATNYGDGSIYNFIDFESLDYIHYYFKDFKVEKGNKATDWTPAPEDVQSNINAAVTTSATYTNSQVSILQGVINLKADITEVTGLSSRVSQAEVDINAAEASILLKADVTTVDGINSRVSNAEIAIDGLQGEIVLKASVSDLTNLTSRVSAAEVKITPEAINLTVSSQITDKVNAIEVGGRNYYSKASTILSSINDVIVLKKASINGFSLTGSPVGLGIARLYNVITSDGEWTVSFWCKANAPSQLSIDICDGASTIIHFTTEYQYYTLTKNVDNHDNYPDVYNFVDFESVEYIIYDFKDFKVEKGNKSTDWTPAPEDVEADIALRPTEAAIKSSFNMTPNSISLLGQTIDMSGKVTFSSLDGNAQTSINTANSNASAALSNAATAQSAADAANTAALNAAGIANGKGKVLYSATAPTGSDANANNLWIRTSDNKPHTYSGGTWVSADSQTAIDAANAASTAQSAANTAQSAAEAAQTTANNANNNAAAAQLAADAANSNALAAAGLADSKGKVLYAAIAPTGADADVNNLWIRTSDNKPHTYNGSIWVAVESQVAIDAANAADAAQDTANNALSSANTANSNLSALQLSLGELAYENLVGTAKLDNTVIEGGYIKATLLNVEEIFSKNVTATGLITATNLTVTGNSKVGDFRVVGSSLRAENTVTKELVSISGSSLIMRKTGTPSSQEVSMLFGAAGFGQWSGLRVTNTIADTSFAETTALSLEARNNPNGTNRNIALEIVSGGIKINGRLGQTYKQDVGNGYFIEFVNGIFVGAGSW